MNRMLFDDPPLVVSPRLAQSVGLSEAIILQQIHYWITGKSAHEYEGKKWIYNTYQEWHEQFPFWSEEAIRKIVKKLESDGLIISSQAFNQTPMDRTKWYTINYDRLKLYSNPVSENNATLGLSHPENFPDACGSFLRMHVGVFSGSNQRLPETTNNPISTTPSRNSHTLHTGYDEDPFPHGVASPSFQAATHEQPITPLEDGTSNQELSGALLGKINTEPDENTRVASTDQPVMMHTARDYLNEYFRITGIDRVASIPAAIKFIKIIMDAGVKLDEMQSLYDYIDDWTHRGAELSLMSQAKQIDGWRVGRARQNHPPKKKRLVV